MANIKCYNFGAKTPVAKCIVRIAKTDDGFVITKNGKTLEFKVSLLQFKPDMANIFEGYHDLFIVWSSGNSSDKGGCSFLKRVDYCRLLGLRKVDSGKPYNGCWLTG